MRKYYIPTTTLNFNNILASESISPKAFYALRGFGYPSWKSIPENYVDNAIILYERPFNFTRPESDFEDHPMLIEIFTDEQFPSVGPEVVYCDHTICLPIGGTRFIFFSEQDKQVTLSRSEHSIETKYYKWVWEEYVVVKHFPDVEKRTIQLDIELNQKAIGKDYLINKMKGLLYGFFIGKVLSCPLDEIRQLQILQELQNIATTLLSSQGNIPTPSQIKLTYDLLKEYQKYSACGYILQELNADWEIVYDKIPTLLVNGATFTDLFDIRKLMGNFILSKSHPFVHWLEKEQKKHEKWLEIEASESDIEMFRKGVYRNRFFDGDFEQLEPENEEIVITDLCLSKIKLYEHYAQQEPTEQDSRNIELLKNWVNNILLQKKYHGNPNAYRADLSDEITIKAKEVYKESWKDSDIRESLNEMRSYVRRQNNRFTWNEILTSSIAAVIAKGDDWKKLLTFMQSKGMCDYQLAFAFYGELHGFANLDRKFTEYFYGLDYDDAYKDFYHQLLGTYPVMNANFRDEMDTDISNASDEVPLKIPWQSWQDKLRDIISQEKIVKTNKKATMRDFEDAIKQNGSNNDIEKFMDFLLKYDNWHGKGGQPSAAWKRLKGCVESYFTENSNIQQEN